MLCHIFSEINSDVHVSTKIDTFTFYRSRGNRRNVKQMEDFPFLHQILHTRHVDSPVLRWILIRTRVVRDFFY